MRARLSLRAAAVGYLALLLVLPLGMVFWRTFQHGLGPVWGAATAPDALHALWLTVLIALIAVPANTVFAGTTMSAMSTVSQSACSALGAVAASQTGPSPCWKVRQKTIPRGKTSRRAR